MNWQQTGSPSEYTDIVETISTVALDKFATWFVRL